MPDRKDRWAFKVAVFAVAIECQRVVPVLPPVLLFALDGDSINLQSVGVRDIILLGEIKSMLAQVVQAEKFAQDNLIRRREETAAVQ